MKVSDLLDSRRADWQELEVLCARLEGSTRKTLDAPTVARFASLYRAACGDLALADAYQLPPQAIEYLHLLVGRAHNQLYRSRTFTIATWSRQLLLDVPRRLFNDNCLRLAFCIFWGTFLLAAAMAYTSPDFAEEVLGKDLILSLESNYSEPNQGVDSALFGLGAGFYVFHNVGIGFRCFAFGLLFGVGGLYMTTYNAALLGAMFGHMATVDQRDNFFHFVTAHGPFELTAIVLMAAAGMRLGFSLVDTKGLKRLDSLRRSTAVAMPTLMAAMVMFVLAAMLETFLSPSSAPYAVKALVAVLSAGMLMVYFVVLGYPREA